MIASNEKEEKYQVHADIMMEKHQKANIASEYSQQYERLAKKISIDKSSLLNRLDRSQIYYNPASPYQPFSFEVEKIAPSFDFYKINVKIAHFNLTVSAVKLNKTNILSSCKAIHGIFGDIYFVSLGKQRMCIKSFNFKTNHDFQELFPTIIKQWAILKICSSLECGPETMGAFGFDLLIYEDCLQYFTEEGREMGEFTPSQAQKLKEQLAIMHSFNIMHLDIKPKNIIFSRHFKKPVFIDFGFSEIIQENIGYKTLTRFKGTPNFCSSDMMAIMVENEGYVDLYYNDAYSLCLVLQTKQTNIKIIEIEYQDSQNGETSQHDNFGQFYSLLAFQYHYLDSSMVKSRQSLRFCLDNNQKCIKTILKFILKTIQLNFLHQIFEQDLKDFFLLTEYRQIKEQLKLNVNMFFYKSSLNQPVFGEQEDKVSKIELYSLISGTQLIHSHQHYVNTILDLCKLEQGNVINYIAIAFECLRFDVRNMSVEQKKKIAQKMNQLLLLYLNRERETFLKHQKEQQKPQSQQGLSLNQIKITFVLFFEFCLANNSKWVKKNIFSICQQMILLDIDMLEYVEPLAKYAKETFKQPKQLLLLMFEFSRMLNTITMVQSQHVYKLEALINGLTQLSKEAQNKFMALSQASDDKEICALREILIFLQTDKCNDDKDPFETSNKNLKEIKDSQMKKYVLFYLTRQKIQHFFDSLSIQQVLEIVQFTKHSSELRSIDFFTSTLLTIKILITLSNFAGLQAYCNYIEKIINCRTISQTLKIKQRRLTNFPNQSYIEDRITTIFQKYRYSIMYEDMNYHIIELFIILDKVKLKISPKINDQFQELYKIYSKQNIARLSQPRKKIIQARQFYAAFSDILLDYYFYKFSVNTQEVFIANLAAFEEQSLECKRKKQLGIMKEQSTYYVLSTYKMNLYHYYYYFHNRQYQKCLICLDNMEEILICLHLNFLRLQIMKLQIQITIAWKRMDLIKKAVYYLYKFCTQVKFQYFFLIPQNENITFVALTVFQSYDIKLFYSFLNYLTMLLTIHPIEYYIKFFFKVLDKFLTYNRSRGASLHYSKFIDQQGKNNLKENPYLLIFYAYSILNEDIQIKIWLFKKIALNCDRLSDFAKKKILKRCFRVYFDFCLKDRSISQQIFIFRNNKNYMSDKKCRKVFKTITHIHSVRDYKQVSLKEKLKHYCQFLT